MAPRLTFATPRFGIEYECFSHYTNKEGEWPRMSKQNESWIMRSGWLIQAGPRYYTGDARTPLDSWTAFPQFAKVYQRKQWAQRMAVRLGGQVIGLPEARGLRHP